jgi:hypothetical protein
MTDPTLTAESLKIFDDFYRRRLAEAGGARDDAEELAVARDILLAVVNDGLTPTADGGASYIRRGARDWTDPATVQAAQATSSRAAKMRPPVAGGGPGRSKELLQGLGMLLGVVAIAAWFFWPSLFGGKTKPAQGQAATPAATATGSLAGAPGDDRVPTPAPTLQTELLADIAGAGGVKTGLVAPRTLDIKGVSFIVQPVRVTAGDWPRPDDPRAVSWVYGTVINYALGLEATPDNKRLLASLEAGDELLLRMSTGSTYRFAYADVVRVAPQATEIFRQTRPGLILALLGDETQLSRVVIRAVYVPGGDSDSLRLTCQGSQPLVASDTPPGYVYLAVDYTLQYPLTDGLPLVTASFAHHLAANGLTYPALQTAASRTLGRYPALPELLRPRQTLTTTTIYALPETALQTDLIWQFAPDPAADSAVRVALPRYTGALAPDVAVQRVEAGPEGTLVIHFQVQAPALRGVEVSANDIQVQGGSLSPAGNAFPWRVAAGASGAFSLFVRPERPPLTVRLLEQGFEINWQEGQK